MHCWAVRVAAGGIGPACQEDKIQGEEDLVTWSSHSAAHHAEIVLGTMLASLTVLLLVGVSRNHAEVYSSVSDMQVTVVTERR